MLLLDKLFRSKPELRERSEMARLLAEEAEKKREREERRQWAIEQANFACEGCSVEEVMRAARRFYVEAFGDGWDE